MTEKILKAIPDRNNPEIIYFILQSEDAIYAIMTTLDELRFDWSGSVSMETRVISPQIGGRMRFRIHAVETMPDEVRRAYDEARQGSLPQSQRLIENHS
jgi:hypothetical protein